MKKLLLVFLLLVVAQSSPAVVELSRQGEPVMRIEDVYNLDGVPYVALDEVLDYLEIEGRWDSVEHLYHLPTPAGDAVFFPEGRYLRRGERYIPLKHPARFIDGRLRVPEDFLTLHLPDLLGERIAYRNLNPPTAGRPREGAMDRLFSFLLRRNKSVGGGLRAVAIDPGHGGEDVGVLGAKGVKEKDVNFSLAIRLEKLLKMQLGIPVYLSRDGDYGLSLEEHLKPALREDVDAFVLLHAQGAYSPQYHGITLLIRPDTSENLDVQDPASSQESAPVEPPAEGRHNESRRLAVSLQRALQRAGFNVNGIQESALFPLGRGDLPTVLVEVGYLSNAEEFEHLLDVEYQERMAQALFKGLKGYADLGREGL